MKMPLAQQKRKVASHDKDTIPFPAPSKHHRVQMHEAEENDIQQDKVSQNDHPLDESVRLIVIIHSTFLKTATKIQKKSRKTKFYSKKTMTLTQRSNSSSKLPLAAMLLQIMMKIPKKVLYT